MTIELYHPPRPYDGEPRIDEIDIISIAPTHYTHSLHKYVVFDTLWDSFGEGAADSTPGAVLWVTSGYCAPMRYDPESGYIKLPDAWKLHTKEYRLLQRLCAEKWGHLARPDEERWYALTHDLGIPGGCRYWLGAYDEDRLIPYFKLNGHKINARSVTWSRNGRRTCGNKYCVRKEHAQGFWENPMFTYGEWQAMGAFTVAHGVPVAAQLAENQRLTSEFRIPESLMRHIEILRQVEFTRGEPDNPYFELSAVSRLPEDGEGFEE